MSKFTQALTWVLAKEGGYVNDPKDPGGETKFGISKRAHPGIDIQKLTRQQAAFIYRGAYWLPCRCDDIPYPFSIALFDAAVLHGPKPAIKLFQRTLGVSDDGIVGPITTRAAWNVRHKWPGIVADYQSRRALLCHELAIKNRDNERFMLGWLKRLFSLQKFVHGPNFNR